MKNKLFILGLFLLIALPASAVISVEEATDFDAMQTQGYSEIMADGVQNCKARANGVKYTNAVKQRYDESPLVIRWVRNALIYLDPAYDDGKAMQHEIKYGPSIHDL